MRLSDICRGDLYDLSVSRMKYSEASNVTYALVATCALSVSLSATQHTPDWSLCGNKSKCERVLPDYKLNVLRPRVLCHLLTHLQDSRISK